MATATKHHCPRCNKNQPLDEIKDFGSYWMCPKCGSAVTTGETRYCGCCKKAAAAWATPTISLADPRPWQMRDLWLCRVCGRATNSSEFAAIAQKVYHTIIGIVFGGLLLLVLAGLILGAIQGTLK
jgi:PHP family Zn ribbon phosphoesterase